MIIQSLDLGLEKAIDEIMNDGYINIRAALKKPVNRYELGE